MPWVQAGIAIGGALLSSGGGDDKSWKGEADKQGINTAAVTFQTARNFEALPAKARAIEAQATLAKVEVGRDAAKAASDAIVSAAAAGASGQNVDATVADTSRSADRAKTNIETSRLAGQAQVEQDREDIYWEGDAAKYQYSYTGGKGASTGARLGSALLSGAGAYFGAR